MYEIRNETDRFHVLVLKPPLSQEDVSKLTAEVRALERDCVEPLLLLTDLRGNATWPPDAGDELGLMMRLNDRGVKAHVLVADAGSEVESEARALVDDDDEARAVVTSLDDARRALVDHFGPAEDYAFEDYYMKTR